MRRSRVHNIKDTKGKETRKSTVSNAGAATGPLMTL